MGLFSRRKPDVKVIPVSQMRQSLLDDKAVFLAVIVNLIKKHRRTLESKFEQYREDDDYGNSLVDVGFKDEITYFSDRVVLPELERCIENGKTKYKHIAFFVADMTAISDKENMPTDIHYDDSNQAIVSKLLSAMSRSGDDSLITDDMLRQAYDNNAVVDRELRGAAGIYMEMSLAEPYFGEGIEPTFDVSHFAASVFMIFSVMYNNQVRNNPKVLHPEKTFMGNDPYKYEEYIRDLLRDAGFNAKRTRGSGDFGVDVMARKDGKSFAIQCKLYNHTVGAKAVQEITSGRIFYKTDYAVVVSDNSFTPAAKSLARKSDVILAHHTNILHKLERLIPADDEIYDEDEPAGPLDNQASQEPTAKKQWTTQDADELITVILPTIRND